MPLKNFGAPFGLSRSPGRLRLCPAAPGVLAPLLAGRSETKAEAQGVAADGGLEPGPIRGTGVVRRAEPGTTAYDADGAVRRTDRIGCCAGRVTPVPIRRPFKDVAVHVVKAPWVGRVLPDVGSWP